ncbi:hypothetical protein Tco_0316822 [Tanacetum coccineum]
MKNLKAKIRSWVKENKEWTQTHRKRLKEKLTKVYIILDKGGANSNILEDRMNNVKMLQDLDKIKSLEVAQKAKIKWSIEGEENSKYFHGFIDKQRSMLAIRGILVDGVWIDDPREIDFEKAYNSVLWDYLDDVLRNFGFGDQWRIKVGSFVSRINSWEEIVNKLLCHLSKWKMKTLLIGGRLTLLKSILGSIPIFYMSLFKVSLRVKKKWHIMNVSIHGEDGKLGNPPKYCCSSTWIDIVRETALLNRQGIDLLGFIKKKGVCIGIKNISIAAKLAHDNVGVSLRRIMRGGTKHDQFLAMSTNAEGFNLPMMQDRWFWSLMGLGEFSVALARSYIDDQKLLEVSYQTRWIKAVRKKDFYLVGFRILETPSYEEWLEWFKNLHLLSNLKQALEDLDALQTLVGLIG